MHRTSVISLIATASLAAGCGLGTAGPAPEAAASLVDRTFVSTSVYEGGEPRGLVDGPLTVSFRYPPGDADQADGAGVLVGWTSGCNDYSLLVEVSTDRLEEHEDGPAGPEATLIGCEPAMAEQEGWLSDFFTSSPRWELEGTDLSLANRDVEIDLEEDARGRG